MPVINSYLDTFFVRNNTSKDIALGDLVNISIPPNENVDLLSYPRVTKEKINQSESLQQAIMAGMIVITNVRRKNSRDRKKAILANLDDIRGLVKSKSMHILSPVTTDVVPMWKAEEDLVISKISAVVDAGSMDFELHHTDEDSAFSAGSIIASDITAVSTGVDVLDIEQEIDNDRWIVYRDASLIQLSVTKLTVYVEYRLV